MVPLFLYVVTNEYSDFVMNDVGLLANTVKLPMLQQLQPTLFC